MRLTYGGTGQNAEDKAGNWKPNVVIEVRDAATKAALADLIPPEGYSGQAFPAGQARSDSTGYITFQGPDGFTGDVEYRALNAKGEPGDLPWVRLPRDAAAAVAALEATLPSTYAPVSGSANYVSTVSHRSRQMLAGQPGDDWFDGSRLGIFCHYTWGGSGMQQTRYRDGTTPATLNDLANGFDATRFAADVASFGADYVIFTAWHYAMHVLYPSAVMDAKIAGHTSSRDVIADLIAALKPHGIRLALYVHPIDGHDLTAAEQTATGWNDATDDYAVWQTFINDLIAECGERYGTDVAGFWIDMLQDTTNFDPRFTDVARFRRSLKAGHPRRVILANQGTDDNAATASSLYRGVADHLTREYIAPPADINNWTPGLNNVAAIATTGNWWAHEPQDSGSALKVPAVDMFRYTVLQAGINRFGGGVAWALSPYAGSGPTSLWEDGMEAAMEAVEGYIDPVRESLTNVIASPSYPLSNTLTLNTLGAAGGFVATRSADGRTEYIHVLTPPGGSSLDLSAPTDGAVFHDAFNLVTGRPVKVSPTATGYRLALHTSDQWSNVHTVIAVTRHVPTGERVWIGANLWGSGDGAPLSSKVLAGRWAGYSLSPTTSMQIETTFMVPDHWNTFDIDIYWSQDSDGAGGATLNLTRAQAVPGGALGVDDQGVGQVYVMPGTANALAVLSPFKPMRAARGAINHLRISRGATDAGDTGPTVVILGAMVRRLT